MHNGQTKSRWTRAGALVAAVAAAIATMVAAQPAHAAPLLASHTSVAGYPFYEQGRADVHVVLVADVSAPVLGTPVTATPPTVTFAVGLPGGEVLTLVAPVAGPCLSPLSRCYAITDFHAVATCEPTAPQIWVSATYSGETLGPPLNLGITAPSTSAVQWISRCPAPGF